MKACIKLLRPKHYIKNALVALPAFFSMSIFDGSVAYHLAWGLVAFCAAASFVYVLNDLCDVEKDRAHPTKKNRPIASGDVSETEAKGILILLIAVMAIASCFAGSAAGSCVLAIYVALNVAYSKKLKNVALVDVVILASGYVLRVFYGALVCSIAVSGWLYLTILAASFYMGLGKRSGELKKVKDGEGTTRAVLEKYSEGFLEKNMYMFLGMANIFYALWAKNMGYYMLATVPIVMIMSMRYSMIVNGGDSDGDPISVVTGDKAMIALGLLEVAVMAVLLYSPLGSMDIAFALDMR